MTPRASIQTDVIIVGAGPTGLSLACQLIRHGRDFVILDKAETLTPYSRAIGVQARTLEIYEQIGLAQPAIEQGTVAGKVRLLAGGTVRGEFDLSHMGQGASPYPFVLLLEQSKNERLLHDYLQAHGQEVLWKTGFETLSQTETGVAATVRDAAGAPQVIEGRYLVGCDGAKSPVRHALQLPFAGSTFERMFYVADAQVDGDFPHEAISVCLSSSTFVVFFPLKGERRFRIVGVFPDQFARDEGDVLYDEIERHVKQEVELPLTIHDVEWFSTYKVHTRHVSRFSAGRCFLAGDAAHVHSPAGAQGMNTGIQDAYNLAWKLAAVLQGNDGDGLLETYNEERLENAKNLLQTTDRLFQFIAGSNGLLAFLRNHVFPSVAGYLIGTDPVKHFVFPLISQIGINYRHGSLSNHAGDGQFAVKAGDRLPYFLVDGQSIYDRLREPGYHRLTFAAQAGDPLEWPARPESPGGKAAAPVNLPLTSAVATAFGSDRPFHVLVRPDNYIRQLFAVEDDR
jgi:2-polyprenyl-6-methoxyphenol hydroxylase-like FAD-dependent oxidoreductase